MEALRTAYLRMQDANNLVNEELLSRARAGELWRNDQCAAWPAYVMAQAHFNTLSEETFKTENGDPKLEPGLQAWKDWFEWSGGDPWVGAGRDCEWQDCFFCGEENPSHTQECTFERARILLTEMGVLR